MKNYINIYRKQKKLQISHELTCFICERTFYTDEEECYIEKNIVVYNASDAVINKQIFYTCTKCITSEENAEEIMIPLLKVLYGGKVTVGRINKKTNKVKVFHY